MQATTSYIDAMDYYNSTMESGGVESLEDLNNSTMYINVAIYLYLVSAGGSGSPFRSLLPRAGGSSWRLLAAAASWPFARCCRRARGVDSRAQIFGFLWTLESLNNIGWCAMSGSVSHWFFFREDEGAKTKIPLLRSLG